MQWPNTKTLNKNVFRQANLIATSAHEQKCPFVLNRHDSQCTFSLKIIGYLYWCSNKHHSHEWLKCNQLPRHFIAFSADQSKLGSWKCTKHFLKYFSTFLQKLQRAGVREPTNGCLRSRHSCYKGVIKLRWASLVQVIKSTADVKASLTRGVLHYTCWATVYDNLPMLQLTLFAPEIAYWSSFF